MPQIQTPQFNYLNYGQAIEQGNRNALVEANIRAMPQEQAFQRQYNQNVLAQQDSAMRDDQIKQAIAYVKSRVPVVQDQGTWDAVRNDFIQKNLFTDQELPRQYSLQLVDRLMNLGHSQSVPASVQETQWYLNQPKDVQGTHMQLKRAQQNLNLGDRYVGLDASGRPVASYQKGVAPEQQPEFKQEQAAATAAGKIEGEAVAQAKVDLPKVISDSEASIKLVEDLINHPGLNYITGIYSKAPIVPDTSQAAARAIMDQIEGSQFMEAYQGLKGGGQITEVEGAKATAARSRMVAIVNRGGSKEEFVKAAREYIDAIKSAVNRAREKAGQQPAQQKASSFKEGQTATNPQTGEKLIYRNGAWQIMQ